MRSRPTIVVLGGNAFQSPDEPLTMAAQFRYADRALRTLAPLFQANTPLLLSHGNGPQVGHMLIRVEEALGQAYALPLEVCVAETEGELGYVLQQTLFNVLRECGNTRPVVSLLTQVEVAPTDPAFEAPDKPIGPVYDATRATALREAGFALKEEPGGGWRRVVASPRPLSVVEREVIAHLIDDGVLVIAAGGGGVPVVRRDGRLKGVDAVIDKDRTAALLGDLLDAERLIVVTGVPSAFVDYGSAKQKPIGNVSRKELRTLCSEGHFAPGSMLPKIEAVLEFTAKPDRSALICDLEGLAAALEGHSGTIVRSEAT